jgi:ABC-2 type transport system ATP-binding protein
MIELQELTKRYGETVAVDGLSLTIRPGRVTGFLGPNGAGKSTTMRMILGLATPTSGVARVNGRTHRELSTPLTEIGALLDARALHPGRTARDHLRWMARSNRLSRRRVDEVLELVGLRAVAHRRAGGFSLGMAQRLGIAAALLGDPGVLVLDEPVNGLDADGVRWLRRLLRSLAAEGRTIFLASHLMSEMERTADHLVVIGQGRLLADTSIDELLAAHAAPATFVDSVRPDDLRCALVGAGANVEADPGGGLRVVGLDAAAVGELVASRGIPVRELRPLRPSLEDAYTRTTAAAVEHRGLAPATGRREPGRRREGREGGSDR